MNERLVIVSNRLPVQLFEKQGQVTVAPGAGGLVSSIKSYLRKKAGDPGHAAELPVWIGTLDITEKKFREKNLAGKLSDDDFAMSPVFLPAGMRDKFYNGFCNDTIWPLFHYFPSYAHYNDDYYEQYVLANQRFCEKVVSVYQPGDIIWVHDYHLMLLPAMLRQRLPDAHIGFFLHIPFPAFEVFRMLPGKWRKEILEGLLGADLVGFHTHSYVQYFLNSVRQLLGYEIPQRAVMTPGRYVAVDIFPVSIDYGTFNGVMNRPEIFAERNRIRKRLRNIQLIISVDRLDYTKGIVNRLEGYELFLEKHREYHERVSYLLIVVPSRDIIAKYRENKEAIEGLVSRINGKFGNLEWTPVVYQYKSLDFKRLAGLYLAADVALITPVRDGMNLVAKEFVTSRSDRRGVLILSETAGAAAELGEAIIINPTDRKEVAGALVQALTMPVAEQMSRNEFMQKRLQNYDVVKWAEEFITQLAATRRQQETLHVKLFSPQVKEVAMQEYRQAGKRLFLLDYDGTLSAIARFPHLASPQPALLELLGSLSADDKNTVVLISGRPKDVLESWFGGANVDLVAEHGALYRPAGKSWQQAVPDPAGWKEAVRPVMDMFTDRCPGTFVEEKEFSLAWHYRNADSELGFLRSRELQNSLDELATHLDFHVVEGKKVIEARPRGIDKGTAVSKWIPANEFDFILAAGDDRTDEDMFRVVPSHAYSIRVGLVQSVARFNMRRQEDFISLLTEFTALPPAAEDERLLPGNVSSRQPG